MKDIEENRETKPLSKLQKSVKYLQAIQNMSPIQFDEIMLEAQEADADLALMLQDMRDNTPEFRETMAALK